MSLASGDLTTPARAEVWIPNLTSNSNAVIGQLISSQSNAIYSKLNRPRTFSQSFTRTFNGTGNNQLQLPDYPVTAITSVQLGSQLIAASPLPPPTGVSSLNLGYGYRFVPWNGALPGEPATLEFHNGWWRSGVQNLQVTYTAGYLISNEPATVPATPFQVTVQQPQGICCRDAGVVYAATGVALVAVSGTPTIGQYNPPADANLGRYTFAAADTGAAVLISYSFIPSDLEEACIQMVAERNSYRQRIGVISQMLGGQETVHFMRGGRRGAMFPDLPPEVESLIMPYVNVVPIPAGAPV